MSTTTSQRPCCTDPAIVRKQRSETPDIERFLNEVNGYGSTVGRMRISLMTVRGRVTIVIAPAMSLRCQWFCSNWFRCSQAPRLCYEKQARWSL